MEITPTNGIHLKLYRLALNEKSRKPEYIAELSKNNGHGYEIRESLEIPYMQDLRGSLAVLESLSFKPNESIGDFETINLSSGGSLRLFFEAGYRKKDEVAKSLPNPSDYNYGDLVLLNEDILVFRDEVQRVPSWRVLPRDGKKLSSKEIAFLCRELKLKKRVLQAESHAFHLSRDAFRGSDEIVKTVNRKLEDPLTTEKTEHILPSGKKLYLRMSKGGRIWVALPENGQSLSEEEKKEIENEIGLKLAYELPHVEKTDIVLTGECVERYFRGNEKTLNEIVSSRFKELIKEEQLKDEIDIELEYEKRNIIKTKYEFDGRNLELIFQKKVNKAGNLVWTAPKNMHIILAKFFGFERKNFLRKMPPNAIYLWGLRTKEFWEMPNESKRYGLVHFQKIIESFVGKPNEFKGAYIRLRERTDDERIECVVYLGEDKHGRFYYIEKEDLKSFVRITGLIPKGSKDGLLEHAAVEDEFFQRILDLKKNEKPLVDNRDDGTDRIDLQLIRGGRKIARVREGLEPDRKKRIS